MTRKRSPGRQGQIPAQKPGAHDALTGAAPPKARPAAWSKAIPWALAALAMLPALAYRIALLKIPLERDEGEYAYIGQLILRGIPPFRFASNMKLPGTDAAYALIMAVFGQTPAGIHFGYLLVSAGSVALLYFLGKRLYGQTGGLVAAASYALLSFGPSVLGNAAHATHFVALPAIAATLLLVRWAESRRKTTLLWSGLLYGIAFLMKQPGLVFGLCGGLFVMWSLRREWRGRRSMAATGLFTLGLALPFAATCATLWQAGVFENFWFWTVTYARQYGTRLPLADGWENLAYSLPPILAANPGIWILAAAGLALVWRKPGNFSHALLVAAMLAFSCVAVSAGFYFRQHYFILMFPAVALLAGAGAEWLRKTLGGVWTCGVCAAALALSMAALQTDVLQALRMDPQDTARAIYGGNPFPEAIPIADYLASHTKPDARIAILGSEPEILFYSRRMSATGYVYMYGLMEPQPFALHMQNEMIREIEAARPEYMVWVRTGASWLQRPDSPTRLAKWWQGYYGKYEIAGVADILPSGTVYRWGAEAAQYQPQSGNFVWIGKRRD